jgi:hypothetical protein
MVNAFVTEKKKRLATVNKRGESHFNNVAVHQGYALDGQQTPIMAAGSLYTWIDQES